MDYQDAELLRALQDEHGDALFAHAVRLTGGDRQRAEDLVQETLLRAWRHPEALDPERGTVRSWLFITARNLAIDAWRRRETRVGEVVTDAEGYTLYRFDDDKANPPTTTCVDECAKKWPPVVVDRNAKLRVDGVEDADIGLLERPDGKTQLTIKGWAVYRDSGDKQPGATEGQGVGGTWYAITPQGKKASPA